MTISPINASAAIYLADDGEAGKRPTVVGVSGKVLEELLVTQTTQGAIPAHAYEAASQQLGLSTRQIQRKLAALRASQSSGLERAAFRLTDHHRQAIMACNGNVALAHRQLELDGEALPAYQTFWRAWDAEPPSFRSFAKKGATGFLSTALFTPYEAPERNAVWQADHFELPIDVIGDGCTTQLVKPWLTLFEDDRSRKVMAWALTATPNRRPDAEIVGATLAEGFRIRLEDGIEVGGVPAVLRWDNDLSFTADSISQLGAAIGFTCHAVPPYSGHMKGKIERLGRTIQEQFCVLQPGFTHGRRTHTNKDLFRNTAPLLANELRQRIAAWLVEYDRRQHGTTGQTPLDRWAQDPVPLRRATDEQLRSALLVEKRPHKVSARKGIHFQGQWWVSAELRELVGRSVEVRYPITSKDFIDVYRDGEWRCTAWPATTLSVSQKESIWKARQDDYQAVRETLDEALRLRESAEARGPMTDGTPAVAAMPASELLRGDADELFELLGATDAVIGGVS